MGGASARVTTSRMTIFCPECSWRGSGRWLWMAIQSSGPLESTGMPVTKAGRASLGQNKMSSAGHWLWQRTRRAVSGGMFAVCSSRARLAAWGAADGEETDSEAVAGFVESGSPGRAVGRVAAEEVSAMGGAGVATSGNGISILAAEVETDKRLPRLASQFLAMAFPFVAAEFEMDKQLLRLVGQLRAMAFSFVAAVVGTHLGGLSEGQAERGSQSHWLRQYGRGVAS